MRNLSIVLQIIIYVSILGFTCIFLMAYVSISASERIMNERAYANIGTIQQVKKEQIEEYFKNHIHDLNILKLMPFTKEAILSMNTLIEKKAASSHGEVRQTYDTFAAELNQYIIANGFDDILFIRPDDGLLYFSVNGNALTGSELSKTNSPLTDLWRICLTDNQVHTSDIVPVGNNGNKALYMGVSIKEKAKTIGILVLQINSQSLDALINNDLVMGSTGETFIVGSDFMARTSSRFTGKISSGSFQSNTAVDEALKGRSGTGMFENEKGISMLASYAPLMIDDLEWGLITQIEEDEVMEPKSELINTILIICSIIGIIMMPVLYIIGRTINKPILKGVAFTQKVAEGDLTVSLDVYQKDEIGQLADSLRTMVSTTAENISEITTAANNLSNASQQLSGTSQMISQGSSEQASSVEEVSASVEQMAANIGQNKDNAYASEKISTEVSTEILKASEIVFSAVEALQQISEKISIIGDIAFQTNILALNAAVEAARAGEHGKGFGVVAAEVGKLAEKTKVAATEINDISSNSIQVAADAKKLMSELVPKVQNSTRLVQEISSASLEQSTGAEQINDAIQQLNEITQQNAAASEEMATSAEELSSQAEQLSDLVAYFVLEDESTRKRKKSQDQTRLIHAPKPSETTAKNKTDGDGIYINLDDDNLDDEFEKF